jgi:outer membrane protein
MMLAAASASMVAQTPTKVATIHIQNALVSTKDGQKAAADLSSKFEPRKKQIDAKNAEIAALQQELNRGSNTMADAKRLSLTREIDQKTKSLQRESQDAQEELEQEQNKILSELYQRVLVVIEKYARDNGYAVVLDISSQQTPVVWAANGVDITKEVIDLYDKNAPSTVAPPKPVSGGASPLVPSPVKPAIVPPVPAAKKVPGAK